MKTENDRILLPEINSQIVADEIGDFILGKISATGNLGAVIGLSGGVDSTTTAALAKRAFDNYNAHHKMGLELVGYMLPSKTNSEADTIDGEKVANRLGIRYEKISIEPLLEAFEKTNPEAFKNQYDKGNLASRIRSNVLNTKAATEHKLVLGTGNKDEDFGVGYYTLFGDGAVHLSPIGALSKRLVRNMATHLGFEDLANRVPTAGLEPGQTDFGDLGYSYETVEVVSEGLVQGFAHKTLYQQPQVVSLAQKSIVDYEKEFGKKKFATIEQVVDDIIFRHEKYAIPKGKLISPEIAKISLEYS